MMEYSGNIVDIIAKEIFYGKVIVNESSGKISAVEHLSEEDPKKPYLVPGFVDAHIHVESSMLTPLEFARAAVRHGTICSVSDPHEVANVLGVPGVKFMIENGKLSPFKFLFGCPSCVPATGFETAGASLSVEETQDLMKEKDIGYLSEMMNYPGVLMKFDDVMGKIKASHDAGKPIDGHAPGLSGDALKTYVNAGISSDHESTTIEEGREKVSLGMKILIRQGSAAKDMEALLPLLKESPEMCMFCSDDRHPDDLVTWHINEHIDRALKYGIDLFTVLRVSSLHAKKHFDLDVGMLQKGDAADFVELEPVIRDPYSPKVSVRTTIIDGKVVYDASSPSDSRVKFASQTIPDEKLATLNKFLATPFTPERFIISPSEKDKSVSSVRVIAAVDGDLLTGSETCPAKVISHPHDKYNGAKVVVPVVENADDVCLITVVNRYEANVDPALAFVSGFHLKPGVALASSVAHDSHNIVAVGSDEESLCAAVNAVIASHGGISVVSPDKDGERAVRSLALPIAGILATGNCEEVAENYRGLQQLAMDSMTPGKGRMIAPFTTLSFLSLLVIPNLKLGDRGLFDGTPTAFKFVDVVVQ